ncbi:hypothetical protein GALMADRAFT_136254 [Galerina marginata CBS 339.88]|uniref:Uncharacterized protein n=1 Tax=Galerina marginata (strain CBS 339.88) TaxID=685588 RepID=A0A067TMR7_GALM3|nr:hypothetical protein GALMADRAFT_136254 [Galerina marginata CBS 339.88]
MPEPPGVGPAVPLQVQLSEISSWLNSSLLLNFLTGIYTVIYFGTLYLSYSRLSQRRIVVVAISLLYLLALVNLGLQWWLMQWSFVDNGQTRNTVFFTVYNLPPGVHITSSIQGFLTIILADGLLVWRCFNVWNRSVRMITLPLVLVVTETALFLSTVIRLSVEKLHPKDPQIINNLDGAGYFVSAATSLLTTLLIAYRIHFIFRHDGASRGRFKHLIEILIQSSAVYSLTLLMNAISVILPIDETNTQFFAFQNYIPFTPISGLAPTVMVAQVYLAADNANETSKLTALAFRANIEESESRVEKGEITVTNGIPSS